jgi:hypothetical protein
MKKAVAYWVELSKTSVESKGLLQGVRFAKMFLQEICKPVQRDLQ